jgi:ABC-type dipeptide/oligopeptide/nickel transport system permease subunit
VTSAAQSEGRAVWGRAGTRFRKNRAGIAGAAIVVLLVVFAAIGPLLAHHDPYASDFAHGIGKNELPVGPSDVHLLGADRIFRDELARLAYGARLSLLIGVAATLIASVIGAVVGIVAGWFEGTAGLRVPWAFVAALVLAVLAVILGSPRAAVAVLASGGAVWASGRIARAPIALAGPRINADSMLMRAVDVGLSFPFLLLVMAIGAALDRTTAASIFVILGLTGWLGTARILRAKTMQVRSLDYVVASRALGHSTPAILARHVLPNVTGPLIVIATISVAQMIVAESVLSYLGVGISPPTATWGHMLYEGQEVYQAEPWLVAGPGAAILLAVFGFNLLGEGLRDALDPRED